jgi:hypothetical protein
MEEKSVMNGKDWVLDGKWGDDDGIGSDGVGRLVGEEVVGDVGDAIVDKDGELNSLSGWEQGGDVRCSLREVSDELDGGL